MDEQSAILLPNLRGARKADEGRGLGHVWQLANKGHAGRQPRGHCDEGVLGYGKVGCAAVIRQRREIELAQVWFPKGRMENRGTLSIWLNNSDHCINSFLVLHVPRGQHADHRFPILPGRGGLTPSNAGIPPTASSDWSLGDDIDSESPKASSCDSKA